MIVKHVVKSCCGGKSFVFQTQKPVTKEILDKFLNQNYTTSNIYTNNGIFRVEKQGLIATASFGTTKVNVNCTSKGCDSLLSEFQNLLDEYTKK